ncbi:hypothetical protein QBC47DRAFT_201660 [Echria macrotheca]|uniref:B30.2/SPRY domain-containing protein n=1 Tax=Echria macrotheca TaxID=438768 RepID=A0AAJ0BDG1_9PEZI|nr:hypothetical protein QBC47DRAFT_201660 [Echria macrotheca]
MATTAASSPQRELTPSAPTLPASIPQKRTFEDDYGPAVPSPLNPEVKPVQRVQVQAPDEGQTAMAREKRTKKDSLKKRESKGAAPGVPDSSRATPDPRMQKEIPLDEMAPLRYKLAPPKPSDFEQAKGPVFTNHHEVQDPEGRTIEFLETSEHVHNKKNYHYTHCIADPAFPSMFYYRQTEPEPFGAHFSFEDTASYIFFDRTGTHVTTDKGFRMARANVAIREGRWYWECKITRGLLKQRNEGDPESHGHVRVGFARREASLDAPVGFDAYSYGIRDVAGQRVHMSRPKDFFPAGEDLREGDVIGFEIQLPSVRLHRKVVQGTYNPAVDLAEEEQTTAPGPDAPNIVRDRIPIRFKSHIYFEKIDYHTTKELEDLMNPSPMVSSGPAGSSRPPNPHHPFAPLRTLPNSHIKVYKNGALMGVPWVDLFAFLPPASRMVQQQPAKRDRLDDGSLGYYPAVSVFRGGAAEVNFGPKFWYPPPELNEKQQDQNEDTEMVDADAGVGPSAAAAAPQLQLGKAVQKLRPVCERYDEQIVEDIVYDIIDEVDFWAEDSRKLLTGRAGRDDKVSEAPGMVPGGREEEIKELVQDD